MQKLVSQRELPGELVVEGEHAPIRLLFDLYFVAREGEPATQYEAGVDLRLVFPDGGLLRFWGFFTKRSVNRTIAELEALLEGSREHADLRAVDYELDLRFARTPGDEAHVTVLGQFGDPDEDSVSGLWRRSIAYQRPLKHPTVIVKGLRLARSDVQAFATLLREFLDRVGEDLPEPSVYDD